MSKAVQRRRGTTAEHTTFTGALGELTVDTTKDTVVVHDGTAAGGYPLAREDLNNVSEIPVSKLADGAARQLLQTAANGTDVEWTNNVDVPGTLDVTGLATFDNNVTIAGDLTVNGATTTINSTIVTIDDKLIELGSTPTPTDAGADQGGIVLKGTTDKSFKWVDATDAWTSSEHIDLASGKQFYINGTAALPGLAISGSSSTGLYSPGADQVAISTGGTGRVFVDAAGNVGVGANVTRGTGAVATGLLHVESDSSARYTAIRNSNDAFGSILALGKTRGTVTGSNTIVQNGDTCGQIYFAGADGLDVVTRCAQIAGEIDGVPDADNLPGRLVFYTTSSGANIVSERLRITSTGNVGIGTVSPGGTLDIKAAAATAPLIVQGSASEFARIDSSGRLLVGTSTSVNTKYDGSAFAAEIQVAGTAGAAASLARYGANTDGSALVLGKSRGVLNVQGSVNAEDTLGYIGFTGSDGTNPQTAATIRAQVDGTPGTNDMPGRLVFATTADGASSPTERMRITSAGLVGIGTTSPGENLSIAGGANLYASITSNGGIKTALSSLDGSSIGWVGTVSNHGFALFANNAERARIDSSGRLLLGTSSARGNIGAASTPSFQLEGTSLDTTSAVITRNSNDTGSSVLRFAKSRGTVIGSNSIVLDSDQLGGVSYTGNDGTNFVAACSISAFVDGTPGTNDMPGRIVLATTLDGASSPTEALRITNDRVVCYNQPDVTSKSTAATLTIAELKTGIIQYTGNAQTLTLPTGTLMEGGFSGIYTNMTFEWSVINTGSGTCTIGAGTAHTIVGGATVAAGDSGRFASRRTAANTFVSYRLS